MNLEEYEGNMCPNCKKTDWEVRIVQEEDQTQGTGTILLKWCLCTPWGIISLLNGKKKRNIIYKACKNCGYVRKGY